ncbi:uncharacterized protein LOC114661877 [Erpetoichthys calabaricus]|uniref:uncharacterized protein LOC114661877 n=1 Tax=Erpetoichthys calabaricus TaxID=27687 RepID=UPI00109F7223|nr:uncharacterized protein LOC114661877 [Erpetoichthys calabaricus]
MMHTWLLVLVILASVSPLLAFEVICEAKPPQMHVGNSTSLRCCWKCERKCAAERIMWIKDDHILHEHPPIEYQRNLTVNKRLQFMYQNIGNGEVSLNIENLQLSDEGTYNCLVLISQAYREGRINLNVSDHVNPDEKQKTNFRSRGVGAGATALVIVIIGVAFVLLKKRLECSHFQKKKKLPKTGYGEESRKLEDESKKSICPKDVYTCC